ncbi:threonylcarbamoyladenosine tRNA methylthiotransferase MtaB [Desulfocicer vacuolatum DSM 3385]|uniref:Threonylcarbamoyladenosine tRNA methylthiotransferase MtaB n=1 Tax=Desulfocicer vacuolatum DSM 3385 TaxID=1121400 RepID=A0A1W2E2N2_9BACT|nr:tRNA (N(6)-L-threonylcarbamoyladenosine(37)-C(2))-methylthiotransferase MtaB [Desulfocicer vacuolatum]SMD03959.1 threonylcarbamoyladenosine tRNA methylthiotransferase MtaB [Desulfocicer vacuolatum DSM 3385]
MKLFYITTLGCKVNQYESDGIASELMAHGWKATSQCEKADICIINTCAVTARATRQSRQETRSIIRSNPRAMIIVTGCHAQTAAQEIRKIKEVDYVIGHHDKFNIAKTIIAAFPPDHATKKDLPGNQNSENKAKSPNPTSAETPLENVKDPLSNACHDTDFQSFPAAVTGDNTRAYLKIQDGCNSFCTYCIVPHARGRSRSMPREEVMSHLRALDEKGYAEAILTGIHTGAYGLDFKEKSSLEALLRDIAREKPIHRIRLSSVEPRELTDNIINFMVNNPMFCEHFHIPLQSGDDEILSRMKRPYDAALFKSLVMKIRRKKPFAAIGVDILQGFPGENEEAFKSTFNLIRSLPITHLHVFPFSPREGTPAFNYPDKVPRDIIRERCTIMRSLGERKTREFETRNLGRSLEAVIQDKRDGVTGKLKAMTSNYLTIQVEGADELKKKVVSVELNHIDGNTPPILSGQVLSSQ